MHKEADNRMFTHVKDFKSLAFGLKSSDLIGTSDTDVVVPFDAFFEKFSILCKLQRIC